MDRQELALGFKPASDGLHIIGSTNGLDGAEQSVFEEPIETLRRFFAQEIELSKLNLCFSQAGFAGGFLGQPDGGRRQIKSPTDEAGFSPGAHVMAGAATGHSNATARQVRMMGEEID